MNEFFSLHFDYCLFFCGVSFILLSSLVFPLMRRKRARLPWKYLGLFFLLYGITSWLEMLTLIGDRPVVAAFRAALLVSSFLCLLEFGRAGSVAVGANAPGRWIIFLPAALALAGGLAGFTGLNAAARYLLVLPGGLWASWVFWRYRRFDERLRPAMMAVSLAMVAYGLVLGGIPPVAPFPPAAFLNEASFLSAAGFPVQLVQGAGALLTAIGFWIQHWLSRSRTRAAPSQTRDWHELLILPLFLVGLAAGWFFTSRMGTMRDAQEREKIITLVKTAAAGVDARMVARLTGTGADLVSPDYRILKEKMVTLRKAANRVRFYYLMRKTGDTAIFLVDSEPESSPDYSPPGQVYNEETLELKAAFISEKPVVIGPTRDRWGTWVSASSIIKTDDGRNVGLLAFDINASEWALSIQRVRLGSIMASMLFSSLLIIFYAAQRRNRDDRYALEDAAGEQALLLNTINTQVWYLSSPETYGLVNEAHAAFYGMSAAEVSHRRITDIVPEDEVRLRIEANREVFTTGKRSEMDVWARDARGEKRYLNIVKTPKLDGDGDVEYVVCSAMDITWRKLMESALRMSEAQLRSYFELPLIGIAITSTEKGWIEVNDRLCDMLGYPRQELLGMTWSELTHPDDLAADVEQFNKMLSGGIESYSMDKRFLRKGGEVVWTSLAVGCVRNPDRTVDFVLALIQDIGDRKRAEEALHASEERYRLLAENSTDVIWTMSLDGRFNYVSPSITDLAGFTPEEVRKIPLSSYILPEYIPGVMAELKRELENPPEKRIRSKTMEIQQFSKDGTVIDIEINANWIYNEKGEPVGIQGSTRDIRERKRTEEALHASEERYRLLAENSTDVIWTMTLDGRITYISPSIFRLTGFSQEECLRSRMQDMLVADSVPGIMAELKKELETRPFNPRRVRTVEAQVCAKDGSKIDIEVTATWILNDAGELVGVQGASRDIRERKKAEAELAKSMEEKSVLLRELQHRVKNSMAMIVGLVDLEANRPVGDAAKLALSTVRDRIMSLSDLYDLLYRSEEIKEVRLDLYLGKMCRSLLDSYIPETGRISLRMDLDEARIQVKSAIPIGLIVNEIITNSLKYAFPGARAGTVGVSLRAAADALSLTVHDDGVGLPPGFDGTGSKGMGSMLIQLMVKQLRGSYVIEGEGGTAYRITIPLKS